MKVLKFEEYVDSVNEIFASELTDNAQDDRLQRSNRIIYDYSGMQQRSSANRIKTLEFECSDPEGSGKSHIVKLQIPDYRDISHLRKNISTPEKLQLSIEAGNIKVDCSCEDYRFKGYKYMGTQLGYSIKNEDREPKITNPTFEGSVCKHILAIVQNADKFYDQASKDIEEYGKQRVKYEKERKKK